MTHPKAKFWISSRSPASLYSDPYSTNKQHHLYKIRSIQTSLLIFRRRRWLSAVVPSSYPVPRAKIRCLCLLLIRMLVLANFPRGVGRGKWRSKSSSSLLLVFQVLSASIWYYTLCGENLVCLTIQKMRRPLLATATDTQACDERKKQQTLTGVSCHTVIPPATNTTTNVVFSQRTNTRDTANLISRRGNKTQATLCQNISSRLVSHLVICNITTPSTAILFFIRQQTIMKPDLPSSAAGLATLISGCALVLFSFVLLILVVRRKRCFSKAKFCRCCRLKCCNRASIPAEQAREYLTMEDLLLEVDDGSPPARLATAAASDDNDEGWTTEALVPNILKARIKKRSDSRSDLTTPLL